MLPAYLKINSSSDNYIVIVISNSLNRDVQVWPVFFCENISMILFMHSDGINQLYCFI